MNVQTIIENINAGYASGLRRAGERSLAEIIADLLNEKEPLLKAEASGATVIVTERGGSDSFAFTVSHQGEPASAQKAAGGNR